MSTIKYYFTTYFLILENLSENAKLSNRFISPEVFKGFPNAGERSTQRKGRRKGKSIIATDTPEKNIIEQREDEKNKKKPKLTPKPKTKSKEMVKKVLYESSSSFSDADFGFADSSIDGSFQVSEETNFDELSREPINGDHVVVEFGQSGKKIYYVGQIIGDRNSDGDFEISFLRRQCNTFRFVHPNVADISFVALDDIKILLPHPILCGHTSRQQASIHFGIQFDHIDIR